MNGKFANILRQFSNAVLRFEEVLNVEENEFIRDSAIQRFEFTYELAWKTMKAYLEEKGVKVHTPRDAIKGAFQNRLIPDEPLWLKTIETRNYTTHIYNEAMAEKVYRQLPQYLPLFKALVAVLA